MERVYEKTYLTIVVSIIFIVVLLVLFKEITSNKVFIYRSYQATVVKKDLVMLLVTKSDLNVINRNKYLYIKNKKYYYKIRKIEEDILSRKNISYHSLYLEIKLSKNKKENDVVEFSAIEEKVSFLSVVLDNWKGEDSEEN